MTRFLSALFICIFSIAIFYCHTLLTAVGYTNLSDILPFMASISTNNPSDHTFTGLPVVPPQDPSLSKPADMAIPRLVRKAFLAVEQSEGVGARVRRSIGRPELRSLSPFLMLDHFSSAKGGFPDHPHRGQETITYLLEGAIDHEDFTGNKGTIWPGDLQFMTAGRGIMHAEMPRHEGPDAKPVIGMQLWVDLPKKLKACEPRYRDLRAAEIPAVSLDKDRVNVKVISGQSHGVDSVQELAYTPVWLLDISIKPGGSITQNLPVGWNAFAYILKGKTRFGAGKDAKSYDQYNNVVFEQKGDAIVASVPDDASEAAQFILVAGIPLDQKTIQYGPFVLSSEDEVYQAMTDFQGFANGFERAKGWQSQIGKGISL